MERGRLDHVYAEGAGRAIRVLAPSGYGKTSLAARWVSTDERDVRWVDLGPGDGDQVFLIETLRDALDGIVEIPQPKAPTRAVNPYVAALEEGLVAARRPAPFVLVLDDVHRLRSPGSNWLVSTLISRLPASSTVVLIGRGHHDQGSIGRLRLAPGVVDVTVDDLAFDDSECHQLFERLGVDPRTTGIAELVRELEGWPAGVRLAAEVLRSGTPSVNIADHVNLVDYLRGEWTDRLDDDDRDFLREAACVQVLTGDTCDEVLERNGSGRVLQRLHRDEVVVFALDERDDRYRMHGLLRSWLSAELRADDPDRWTRIHRRAARYWEERGDIDRAVAHLLEAGDIEERERLVATYGGLYFTRGLDETVGQWLGTFEPERIRRSAGLSALLCVRALHRGEDVEANQWLHVLDQGVDRHPGAGSEPGVWWGDVLHAALDERPAAESIPGVTRALDHLDGGAWTAFGCWVQGALAFVDGDLVAARDALRAGVFEAELAGTNLVAGHCLGTMSIIDDFEGDHAAASEHARQAEDAIHSCGGQLLPPTALATAAIALRDVRRHDRDAALASIAAARSSLSGFKSVGPWFNIITRLGLLRAVLLLDDRTTARELMDELEHHARLEPPRPDGPPCSAITFTHQLREQVEAMHVPAVGSSALTEAELRVLHLLPTNLSLADIATQLFLSRNTVKSHVASIYRKLDASRRVDAVERARAAGLLPTGAMT